MSMNVTDPAAVEIKKFMASEEGLPETAGLRVRVVPGGCSGFQYSLNIEEDSRQGDFVLDEKGVPGASIPDDWGLGIEEEGFIVCDAYTHSRDAIDFIRHLATKTGCDVLYDGMIAFSPDELTTGALAEG